MEQEHADSVTGVLREGLGFVQIYLQILKVWLTVDLTETLKASTILGLRILCLETSPFLVPLFPIHLVKC